MHSALRCSFALGIFILSGIALYAQSTSGTILGSVQDTSGGAVPGAAVTIINAETRLSRIVMTDSSGDYDVPSLPPGTYNISVEMKGFKRASLSGVRLNVDQKARVDLKLEVGESPNPFRFRRKFLWCSPTARSSGSRSMKRR